MALTVVFYESAPDAAARIPEWYPAHREHVERYHALGELLMVGTFGDPLTEGSMAVFRTREGAAAFVAEDPFVNGGVVGRWYMREWNEVLSGQ
jgi:uncharacterized protein YciI